MRTTDCPSGGQFYWWRKPEYPEKTRQVASHWQTLSHDVEYISSWTGFELTASVMTSTDCIGSCKSNYICLYHAITTTSLYNIYLVWTAECWKIKIKINTKLKCVCTEHHSRHDCPSMYSNTFDAAAYHYNHHMLASYHKYS